MPLELPRGVGLWLRSWRYTTALPVLASPAAAARAYRAAGMGWASPVVMRVTDRGPVTMRLEAGQWRAWRAAGVPMWGTVLLPRPTAAMVPAVRLLARKLADLGAAGVILDPELEYKGFPSAARELDMAVSEECQRLGMSYGVTSYSVPGYHPTFPWAEFVTADFAIAQTYDRDSLWRPDYVEEAVSGWEREGYERVMPARGLNDHRTKRTRAAANLRHHLCMLPLPAPSGAVAVWGPQRIPAAQWRMLGEWAQGRLCGPSMVSRVAGAAAAGAALLVAGLGLAAAVTR